MRGKFLNKDRMLKTNRVLHKLVPTLSVLVMGFYMGMTLDEESVLSLLNTSGDLKLTTVQAAGVSEDRSNKTDEHDNIASKVAVSNKIVAEPVINSSEVKSNTDEELSNYDNGIVAQVTNGPAVKAPVVQVKNKKYTKQSLFDYDKVEEMLEEEENGETPAPTVSPVIDENETTGVTETKKEDKKTEATVKPTYEPQDCDKFTSRYEWKYNTVNTVDPEHRFETISKYKSNIKKAFSTKYYDKKIGLEETFDVADTQLVGNVYYLYNYQELRQEIEKKFGIENIYCLNDRPKCRLNDIGKQATPLCRALSENKTMEKALTDKSNREFLTDLAVKYNITTADDPSAPEAVLGVYYGIFNNDFSSEDVKYTANKKISRKEFYRIIIKANYGWAGYDLRKGQSKKGGYYVSYTEKAAGMLAPAVEFKDTSKISKIEVLTMISNAYFGQYTEKSYSDYDGRNYEMANHVKVTDKELISVIKKYNLSKNPSKYLKDAKKAELNGDKYSNTCTYKLIFKKSSQLTYTCLKALARCDKMGVIQPNSKGKINLYAPVTEKEAIKLITKGAIKCTTYYDAWSGCGRSL